MHIILPGPLIKQQKKIRKLSGGAQMQKSGLIRVECQANHYEKQQDEKEEKEEKEEGEESKEKRTP